MKKSFKIIICAIIAIILVAAICFFITYRKADLESKELVLKEPEIQDEVIVENKIDNEIENDLVDEENLSIVDTFTPTGFAGSSLFVLNLYSDGTLYLNTYDGNGFKPTNIIKNTLIAKNVESLNKSGIEDVIVKGNNIEILNQEYLWIIFEK